MFFKSRLNIFLLLSFVFFIAAEIQAQKRIKRSSLDFPFNKEFIFSTRIGLNTINQFNLQFQKKYSRYKSWVIEVGVNPGEKNTVVTEGSRNIVPIQISERKRGFILRMGFSSHAQPRFTGESNSIFLDIRKSVAYDVIEDRGRFSGSSSSYYAIYDYHIEEIGMMFFGDFGGGSRGIVNLYAGLGMAMRKFRREYTYKGVYSSYQETDLVETGAIIVPRFDLGIRINFLKWKSIPSNE